MKHSHFTHNEHMKRPGMSLVENRAQRNLSNWVNSSELEYQGIVGIIGILGNIVFFGIIAIGSIIVTILSFLCNQIIFGIPLIIFTTFCCYICCILLITLIKVIF